MATAIACFMSLCVKLSQYGCIVSWGTSKSPTKSVLMRSANMPILLGSLGDEVSRCGWYAYPVVLAQPMASALVTRIAACSSNILCAWREGNEGRSDRHLKATKLGILALLPLTASRPPAPHPNHPSTLCRRLQPLRRPSCSRFLASSSRRQAFLLLLLLTTTPPLLLLRTTASPTLFLLGTTTSQ